MSKHCLNLLGLSCNILGALLLLFFPVQVEQVTETGNKITTFYAEVKVGHWCLLAKRWGPRIGVLALLVGYALQFAAAI